MEMTTDLARCRPRQGFVAKREMTDRQGFNTGSAKISRWIGIMVACNPEPLMCCAQCRKAATCLTGHALIGSGIVKTIAQADHGFRFQAVQCALECLKRCLTVIGR